MFTEEQIRMFAVKNTLFIQNYLIFVDPLHILFDKACIFLIIILN